MDLIQQDIRVSFKYPVHFTRDVFSSGNALLQTLVTSTPDPRPAEALFVVDAGVERAHRDVVSLIEAYCRDHAAAIKLAAPVLIVPGGEHVKNDPRHTDAIHHAINGAGLCRHSYVVAIGGGADARRRRATPRRRRTAASG